MAVHKFMSICATSAWLAAVVFAPGSASAHPPPEKSPLETVSSVDLVRYMGTWYEIARTPNRFENKCAANVVVYYALNEEGKVSLRNQCRLQNGSTDTAQGRGSVVDPVSKAKLRVTFFWPFFADYWIIDLDKDYRYAVVGEPDRKYLWIISRTPQLDDITYRQILERISASGYDLGRIVKTTQISAPPDSAAK